MNIILLIAVAVSVLLVIFFYLRVKRLKNLLDKLSMQDVALSKAIEEIKKKTEGIMDSFSSPVLIIDKAGLISFANKETKKLLGTQNIEGNNYIKFFREAEFIDAIKGIHKDSIIVEKEIFLNSQTFLSSFSPSGSSGDVFVSLRDITGEKELERIKRELVTNMSHELKTPLTAIKGYVETLYEEMPDGQKTYIDIIRKHTDRLINIVNDILSLSELEEAKNIEFERIDIKEVLTDVLKMFDGKIRSKNLTVRTDIDEENRHIAGDRFKLEQLFINLIDNAVRYTDKGSISIRSFRNGDLLATSIKDTGIGIPGKSLPRLFERFYVVDRSRSRETGGTGLGLSIVKHIAMLHKGTIDIKSSSGSGTEVIISLPLLAKPS
jgi:two-component system, OmpR family, phosphate regulon sensor histidine kinase PhoR